MTKFPFYPLDRQNEYETYAAEYRFDQTEPTPWMPLRKELKYSRLAVVTTAAARLKSEPAFARGGADIREFSVFTAPAELEFDDASYPTHEVKKDINVLLPLEPIISLTERRVVGELFEKVTSFYGACQDLGALRDAAQRVADSLRAADVDVAMIFTAGLLCNQTAGIVARELEKKGISTIALVTVKEVAREIRIPRSVFINFPFGMVLGRAFAKALQQSIVNDIVHALKVLDKPAKLYELPYKWEGYVE